jgi:hypothetical protein
MKIDDLLARRTDLSTFLVHLTRTTPEGSAEEKLKGIFDKYKIIARSPFGSAVKPLQKKSLATDCQRAVCFTETPMEHIALLTEQIEGRDCHFEPYGIAITKMQGRSRGVNPVWYVDITPGHTWLTRPINELIGDAITSGSFEKSPIAMIAPFIEQMGSGDGYKKEFWWEREWRHIGDFTLPCPVIGLCPMDRFQEFESIKERWHEQVKFVDPRWSLERIIGHLAGIQHSDLGPM